MICLLAELGKPDTLSTCKCSEISDGVNQKENIAKQEVLDPVLLTCKLKKYSKNSIVLFSIWT